MSASEDGSSTESSAMEPPTPKETVSGGVTAPTAKQTVGPVKEDARDHEPILNPDPHDVLMGRGAPSTDFPGNLYFRQLVKQRRHEYVNVKRRKEKQIIAGEIVATVKSRGGRFLERVETYRTTGDRGRTKKTTVWEPVEDRKTLLVKVKQAMRDVGPEAQEKRLRRRELSRRHGDSEHSKDKEEEEQQKPRAAGSLGASAPEVSMAPSNAYLSGFSPSQVLYPTGTVAATGSAAATSTTTAAQSFQGLQGQRQTATNEYMLRLRLEQEAELRREILLRQQLQQTRWLPLGMGGVDVGGASANLPSPLRVPNAAGAFTAADGEALLTQRIRLAQDEALLQQYLEQQSRLLLPQAPALGLASLPSASLANQAGLLAAAQPRVLFPPSQAQLLNSILQRAALSSAQSEQPDRSNKPPDQSGKN